MDTIHDADQYFTKQVQEERGEDPGTNSQSSFDTASNAGYNIGQDSSQIVTVGGIEINKQHCSPTSAAILEAVLNLALVNIIRCTQLCAAQLDALLHLDPIEHTMPQFYHLTSRQRRLNSNLKRKQWMLS